MANYFETAYEIFNDIERMVWNRKVVAHQNGEEILGDALELLINILNGLRSSSEEDGLKIFLGVSILKLERHRIFAEKRNDTCFLESLVFYINKLEELHNLVELTDN